MQATTLPTFRSRPSTTSTDGARLGGAGWEANLLVATPLVLSPGAGGVADLLAVAIAVLSFGLVAAAGPYLPGLPTRPRSLAGGPGRLAAGALAAALAATATTGPGPLVILALFATLEACRRALGPDTDAGLVLLAAGLVLRFDAGAVALRLDPPPATLAAACALALFVALLAARSRSTGAAARLDLALLAAGTGAVALHAAALLDDPRVRDAAGVWPLLAVPLVVAGLAGLQRRAGMPRGETAGLDRLLLATALAWAGLTTLLLRGGLAGPA